MSVRVEYEVAALRKQIEAKRDTAIRAAQAEYDEMADLPARREKWRAEQERRVRSLARRLKDVPDNELGSFKVPACPTNDRYRTPEVRLKEAIADAEKACERALRRLEGMRAKDGVLHLTSAMLRDWFGL